MDWLQAVVLGIVEGVTEYLPISSTGHLILAQRAMGIEGGEAADAYAICIQAGAILAVLALYHRRVRQAVMGVLGRDRAGLGLVVNLAAAFLPAVVVGLLFEKGIKSYLFNLPSIAAAWFAGGVVILLVSVLRPEPAQREGRDLDDLDWRSALIIGGLQCLAMWPGTSRSLVTILGGLLVGLSLPAAVEFSFLLGVLTLSAATARDAWQSGSVVVSEYGVVMPLLGFAVAGLSAAGAVKWMVGYLNRHGLALFGWYRVGAAVVLAGLLISGLVTG